MIEGQYGLRVTELQKSPFARHQAFVRLSRLSDRDSLVFHSPHQFHGLRLSFVNHNRGPNARRVVFNRECWLMLIGFPSDSRNIEDIRDSIKSFGRLILWQKDDVLARIIIKARVTDLQNVPHYLIFSKGDDFEGVSLTVQCEIIQQQMLGNQLQDADIPPGGLEDNQFVFPGFGQGHMDHLHLLQQGNMNQNQGNMLPDLYANPDPVA